VAVRKKLLFHLQGGSALRAGGHFRTKVADAERAVGPGKPD